VQRPDSHGAASWASNRRLSYRRCRAEYQPVPHSPHRNPPRHHPEESCLREPWLVVYNDEQCMKCVDVSMMVFTTCGDPLCLIRISGSCVTLPIDSRGWIVRDSAYCEVQVGQNLWAQHSNLFGVGAHIEYDGIENTSALCSSAHTRQDHHLKTILDRHPFNSPFLDCHSTSSYSAFLK